MAKYKINPVITENQLAMKERYETDRNAKQIIDLRTGLIVLKTSGSFEEGDENSMCQLNSDVNDVDGVFSEAKGI